MENLWKLLKAIFILQVFGILLMMSYILELEVILVLLMYAAFLGVPIAITMGLFAIIDHHREREKE